VDKSNFSENYNVLRRLLRRKRLFEGRTQIQVAKILDVPQSYVSKYESGERRLDLVEVWRVCRALDIDLESFVHEFVRSCEVKNNEAMQKKRRV